MKIRFGYSMVNIIQKGITSVLDSLLFIRIMPDNLELK